MNSYRKKRCVEIARSLKDIRTGRCLHFSFILNKNKLLTFSANDCTKQHPSQIFGKFIAKEKGPKYIAGLHAEIAALRTYLKQFGNLDMSGLTLFNVRIGRNGETLRAAPCFNCTRVLSSLNFKAIEYT